MRCDIVTTTLKVPAIALTIPGRGRTNEEFDVVDHITHSAKSTIYALHSGDYDFKYVGVTQRSPESRLSKHHYAALSGSKKPVHEWMRTTQVFLSVLEDDLDYEDAMQAEVKWVAILDTFASGLNQTLGGKGTPGYKHTDETRARLSSYERTEAGRQRMREAKLGTKASGSTRAKMSETRRGVPKSPDHVRKVSEALRGKPNVGSHNRWHVNRGIVSASCSFCVRTEA